MIALQSTLNPRHWPGAGKLYCRQIVGQFGALRQQAEVGLPAHVGLQCACERVSVTPRRKLIVQIEGSITLTLEKFILL